jgi:hypothetical protein
MRKQLRKEKDSKRRWRRGDDRLEKPPAEQTEDLHRTEETENSIRKRRKNGKATNQKEKKGRRKRGTGTVGGGRGAGAKQTLSVALTASAGKNPRQVCGKKMKKWNAPFLLQARRVGMAAVGRAVEKPSSPLSSLSSPPKVLRALAMDSAVGVWVVSAEAAPSVSEPGVELSAARPVRMLSCTSVGPIKLSVGS